MADRLIAALGLDEPYTPAEPVIVVAYDEPDPDDEGVYDDECGCTRDEDQLATSGAWGAFLVVDTETTGLDPHEDRIVEIAAVLFEAGAIVERFSTRVNPGRPIPPEATAVHGITDADVADAPTFAEAWLLVTKMAERAILTCAYSQKFDRDFCRAELVRANLPQPPIALRKPWLDPLVFVRHFDRYVPGAGRHKLAATCERRKVSLVKAHSAEDDAVAAGLLWLAMEQELREAWKSVSPVNVLRIQAALAEQQDAQRAAWITECKARDEAEAARVA